MADPVMTKAEARRILAPVDAARHAYDSALAARTALSANTLDWLVADRACQEARRALDVKLYEVLGHLSYYAGYTFDANGVRVDR